MLDRKSIKVKEYLVVNKKYIMALDEDGQLWERHRGYSIWLNWQPVL